MLESDRADFDITSLWTHSEALAAAVCCKKWVKWRGGMSKKSIDVI